MFGFNEKNNPNTISCLEINKMISDICKGVLGKTERYWSDANLNVTRTYAQYSYDDGELRLEYSESSFSGKTSTFDCRHKIYIDDKCVWPAKNISTTLIERLRTLYKKHLEETKNVLERSKLEKYQAERKENVAKIFKYVYPRGYNDDIITITDVKMKQHESYSSMEAETIYSYSYSGKICFLDGTVLCDTNNDIYHPGKWEDYVAELAKKLKLADEQNKKEQENKMESTRQRKIEREKRIYELNHAPIDDSKYFK